jgi:putative transposase
MAAVSKPEENGYAERLMKTIKEEEVDLSDYRILRMPKARSVNFWRMCTITRYLTPAEFEAASQGVPAVGTP